MGGACSMYGEKRNSYRILVGKSEKRKYLHGPDVKGRKILRCVLNRMEERGMD
jgi:hypothetical protein